MGDAATQPGSGHDPVSRPSHYTRGKIEVLDFIEDQKLAYHLGNVIKYVCRASYKGREIEDLRKARFYLDRHIALREAESAERESIEGPSGL